tara:strand:- start:208 stop:429 length:222 start_codon:yes stop_codon:yes gene_type:complete
METRLGGHTEKLPSQRNVVRARGTSNFLVAGNAYVCDKACLSRSVCSEHFRKSFVIERSRRELIRILPKAEHL